MKKIKKSVLKMREKRRLNREKKEAWTNVRIKALVRDNCKCLICDKDLSLANVHNRQVHHILDKKNYPQFALDLENLITLCWQDHKVGPCSPHLNALAFMEIFKRKRPEQYAHLKKMFESSNNNDVE